MIFVFEKFIDPHSNRLYVSSMDVLYARISIMTLGFICAAGLLNFDITVTLLFI